MICWTSTPPPSLSVCRFRADLLELPAAGDPYDVGSGPDVPLQIEGDLSQSPSERRVVDLRRNGAPVDRPGVADRREQDVGRVVRIDRVRAVGTVFLSVRIEKRLRGRDFFRVGRKGEVRSLGRGAGDLDELGADRAAAG